MTKWYTVEWYKECYPLRGECGKLNFLGVEDAKNFWQALIQDEYEARIIVHCGEEDC